MILVYQDILQAIKSERLAMVQKVKDSNAAILRALLVVSSDIDWHSDADATTSTSNHS